MDAPAKPKRANKPRKGKGKAKGEAPGKTKVTGDGTKKSAAKGKPKKQPKDLPKVVLRRIPPDVQDKMLVERAVAALAAHCQLPPDKVSPLRHVLGLQHQSTLR